MDNLSLLIVVGDYVNMINLLDSMRANCFEFMILSKTMKASFQRVIIEKMFN